MPETTMPETTMPETTMFYNTVFCSTASDMMRALKENPEKFEDDFEVCWRIGCTQKAEEKAVENAMRLLQIAGYDFTEYSKARKLFVAKNIAKRLTFSCLAQVTCFNVGISEMYSYVLDYYKKTPEIVEFLIRAATLSDIKISWRDRNYWKYEILSLPNEVVNYLYCIIKEHVEPIMNNAHLSAEKEECSDFKSFVEAKASAGGGLIMIYKKFPHKIFKAKRRCYHPHIDMNSYGAKETLRNLRLGLELECEAMSRYGFNQMERDFSNFFYTQRDGSLDDDFGREITLFPINYKDLIEDGGVIDFLIYNHTKGWAHAYGLSQCGLHIHVSRSLVENKLPLEIFMERLFRFYYGVGSTSGWNEAVFLRKEGPYRNKIGFIRNLESIGLENIKKGGIAKALKEANCDVTSHHTEISLHNSGKTIEFRIGKGTLQAASIKCMCEYVAVMTRFCCTGFADSNNLKDSFLKFCKKKVRGKRLINILYGE